jgi:surface protein
MFKGCTNLNNINVSFSAWNPSYVTECWVENISSSGTFTCPADLPEEFGTSRIPTGWTVVRK